MIKLSLKNSHALSEDAKDISKVFSYDLMSYDLIKPPDEATTATLSPVVREAKDSASCGMSLMHAAEPQSQKRKEPSSEQEMM
ncbi:hypothetical protein M513_04896 [Trichuris suis]|uniref:Uncharacterized protein n=1 Tax=Trichuris suis TaxID=68888 RepID=A0A085MA73_9BILA|nr:hypothetical protein M513_04896 [Trichuris suis]